MYLDLPLTPCQNSRAPDAATRHLGEIGALASGLWSLRPALPSCIVHAQWAATAGRFGWVRVEGKRMATYAMYETMHGQPDDVRHLLATGWPAAEDAAARLSDAPRVFIV